MDKDKEYIIEDVMKSVERQLKEIHADDLHADFPVDTGKKVQDEIISKERESLDLDTRPVFNGFVEIRVSDDDMIVRADFYPPSKGGKVIEEEEIRDRLEVLGWKMTGLLLQGKGGLSCGVTSFGSMKF